MSEKVKVSREVADAIEVGRKKNKHISLMVERHMLENYEWTGELKPLNSLSADEFIIAFYVGYEIEQTPEERLGILFTNCKYSRDSDDEIFARGIKKAIDILGIKIEGVND